MQYWGMTLTWLQQPGIFLRFLLAGYQWIPGTYYFGCFLCLLAFFVFPFLSHTCTVGKYVLFTQCLFTVLCWKVPGGGLCLGCHGNLAVDEITAFLFCYLKGAYCTLQYFNWLTDLKSTKHNAGCLSDRSAIKFVIIIQITFR